VFNQSSSGWLASPASETAYAAAHIRPVTSPFRRAHAHHNGNGANASAGNQNGACVKPR